jgi:hypothetical protein
MVRQQQENGSGVERTKNKNSNVSGQFMKACFSHGSWKEL